MCVAIRSVADLLTYAHEHTLVIGCSISDKNRNVVLVSVVSLFYDNISGSIG